MKPAIRLPLGLLLASLVLLGCESPKATLSADQPEMAAFINLMMPRKIEIQHYLTQPRSFDGSGNANGIEIILAAKDAFGDDVKCVGTFCFELHTLRMASGDKFGKRVGFWTVTVGSEDAVRTHWDRLARFYKFKLELDEGRLEPGGYILTAQLTPPTGERLFSEYSFQSGEGGAAERKPGE